eukprot:TRINITY_DN2654_c0_g1_i2.p1 TRINITY_DN2654_c0_g1~~TRINITY_DN2654_c0_g1_i2.p1  ORF type:complete len:195 (-),score=49.34 TRINITY_DN2654_c0_g1_i2:147-731(-)
MWSKITARTVAAAGFIGIGFAQGFVAGKASDFSSFFTASADTYPIRAVCMVKGDNINGTVRFTQTSPGKCTIEAEVDGLPEGAHGFHIHELGDLSKGCETAKAHYNPFGNRHGGPTDSERHVGDLGNIVAPSVGVASYKLEDSLVKLEGPHSVIGRSIVIHADEDDLGKGGHADSLSTGHAGKRVCCGVIGRAS